MELLQPICCAVSLIGVHFTRPYLSLLLDTETTFDTLREAIPIFYSDLKETECILLVQTKEQVCTFVSPKKFRTSLPKDCLLEILGFYSDQYQRGRTVDWYIHVAHGRRICYTKGAIFGFGPSANDSTGNVLKISEVEGNKRRKLNQTSVHNLNEERSVGVYRLRNSNTR